MMKTIDVLDRSELTCHNHPALILRSKVNRQDDREGWLDARKDCLTGSKAYDLTGLSPFTEPEGAERIPEGLAFTDIPDDDPYRTTSRRMLVGSLMEGAIVNDPALHKQWLQLWPGADFIHNSKDWFYLHPAYKNVGATPDVLVMIEGRVVGVIEIKFMSGSWSNEYPPLHYLLQTALTAEVMGAPTFALSCWYPAMNTMWYQTLPMYSPLVGKDKPFSTADYRTPDGLYSVKDICQIWEDRKHEPANWPDLSEYRIYMDDDDNSWVVEADPDLHADLKAYQQTNNDYRAISKTRQVLRAKVLDGARQPYSSGERTIRIVDKNTSDQLATIRTSIGRRLDVKTLEEEEPNVYDEYQVASSRTTLKVNLP